MDQETREFMKKMQEKIDAAEAKAAADGPNGKDGEPGVKVEARWKIMDVRTDGEEIHVNASQDVMRDVAKTWTGYLRGRLNNALDEDDAAAMLAVLVKVRTGGREDPMELMIRSV